MDVKLQKFYKLHVLLHYLNANYSDEKNTNIAMSIKTFTEVSIYNGYDKLLVIT